ncbi:MAG: hypothetical protein GX975_03505 [Clostridiales bacterium]|nr:hypothetical protein [Clostridiales bacterium]
MITKERGLKMATEKLFQNDAYLKEMHAEVTAVRMHGGRMQIALDRSVFFPEGGGQPADQGFLDGIKVVDVQEDADSGDIWHILEKEGDFKPGQRVCGRIDWDRRFDHMQMHCGEHILSGRFHELFGVENRGFHMGSDYMTIDMAAPEGRPLTDEQIREAEIASNEIIWENLPVRILRCENREDAERLPLRKLADFVEGDVSVVLIGDEESPADCCACCGTHPLQTGSVGLISVLKAETYKGMTRLTIKAGRFALEEYMLRSDAASALAKKYSCELAELIERDKINDVKNEEIRRELAELRSAIAKKEEEKLREALDSGSGTFEAFTYELQSANDLQAMASRLKDSLVAPLALLSERDCTVVIASPGEPDAGKLVGNFAKLFAGKGGGNRQIARAIFQSSEDAKKFIDQLKEELR